jgi:hypothetical protein
MRIGTSLFLLALGAILAFAVTDSISGIELTTVGWILIGVGALGLVLSLLYENMWRDRATATPAVPVARERVVERDPYA